jgi:hypothetical protein
LRDDFGPRNSIWLDSFADFDALPGDEVTRAKAMLRLGVLGIEPLRWKPQPRSRTGRLLTPARRWVKRVDDDASDYDDELGLDIPLAPMDVNDAPLSPETISLLDELAIHLGEVIVTHGWPIEERHARVSERLAIGCRLDGAWIALMKGDDPDGAIPIPPHFLHPVVELLAVRPDFALVQAKAWGLEMLSRVEEPRQRQLRRLWVKCAGGIVDVSNPRFGE